DGQHRVYGFSLAKKKLRVPVVIYTGLSRTEEARLFMDINTKQKPVPNPLLLDIKALADAEEGDEPLLRSLFDLFHEDPHSVLSGLTTPAISKQGLINRVTFNSGAKIAITVFREKKPEKIYEHLNNYLIAIRSGLHSVGIDEKSMTKTTIFKSLMAFFPIAARRLHARYGVEHSSDNYAEILSDMWPEVKISKLKKPGSSYRELAKMFENSLNTGFQI